MYICVSFSRVRETDPRRSVTSTAPFSEVIAPYRSYPVATIGSGSLAKKREASSPRSTLHRLCRYRFRTHACTYRRERMDEAVTTPPTFKRNFFERIYCVEFSPYEWSQHLICIALAKEIVVGTVRFQVCLRDGRRTLRFNDNLRVGSLQPCVTEGSLGSCVQNILTHREREFLSRLV